MVSYKAGIAYNAIPFNLRRTYMDDEERPEADDNPSFINSKCSLSSSSSIPKSELLISSSSINVDPDF
jgi:hypothetical protein